MVALDLVGKVRRRVKNLNFWSYNRARSSFWVICRSFSGYEGKGKTTMK